MDIEQRKMIINRKLELAGDSIASWCKKEGLDQRMVLNLIDEKLLGTRGIPLNARVKMEEFFGNIFDK